MTKNFFCAIACISIIFGFNGQSAKAQGYMYDIGNPSYSVNYPVENGYINIANGNLHLDFSLGKVSQRGSLMVAPELHYDSHIWKIIDHNGNRSWQPTNTEISGAGYGALTNTPGWNFDSGFGSGSVNYEVVENSSTGCSEYITASLTQYGDFTYTDRLGTIHPFDLEISTPNDDPCPQIPTSPSQNVVQAVAADLSGYTLVVSYDMYTYLAADFFVYDKNGDQVYSNAPGSPSIIDRNGNYLSVNNWSQSSNGNWSGTTVDTLGRTPLILSYGNSQTYYDVLIENGRYARYTINWESIPVQTTFNESEVADYTGNISVIQSIVLPDKSQYSFTYTGDGEMTSMTLPTGATISYQYEQFIDSYSNTIDWINQVENSHGSVEFLPSVATICTKSGTDGTYATGCQEAVHVIDDSGSAEYLQTLDGGSWATSIGYASSVANIWELYT